jgi:hypothetical protein
MKVENLFKEKKNTKLYQAVWGLHPVGAQAYPKGVFGL